MSSKFFFLNVLRCIAWAWLAGALPVGAAIQEESTSAGVPDLRIVGWTVDDSVLGNGDGGLHPGETALLQIFLSNQGNETARSVAATLFEVTDHPDIEILDKFALWPDLVATGVPGASDTPHFRIQVAQTRPCYWEVPLRLEIVAADGYFETREFTLVMVDPRTTDLAEGAARPFYFGADPFDGLGGSVAAGDLDGDGFDDLILGAPGGDGPVNTPFNNAGEVVVVYGGPVHLADTDLASPPPDIAFIFGEGGSEFLGQSVAAADLDGDGFDDLILGATGGDGPGNTRGSAGEVVIVYGGPVRLADLDLALFPPLSVVYGVDAGDQLGQSVAAGDLDGDGFDDLILGAASTNGPANTRTSAGEVVIVYGGPARLAEIDLASPPAGIAFVFGADAEDLLGRSVAAGDLDGDGFDDLILGASLADGPANTRADASGEVVVVYGGPARLADTDLASPPAGIAFVFGADVGDNLGFSVATGDLDGDGFDDLILGATGGDGPADTRAGAGEVVVVYGGPARLADTDLASHPAGFVFVFGADASDLLGWSVAAGDLNGDGFDDLIMGAKFADGPANTRAGAGEVMVVYGGPARLADTDLASPPAGISFVFGADGSDVLGFSVATGDLDGDGFDDLILGAQGGKGPANTRFDSAGEVAVLPGAARSRYRHDSDIFAFRDATIGTDLGLACDDCAATIPIGFDFDYYGRVFDTLTVSSNGYLTFNGPGNLPAGFCPPASNPPNATIAVLWDDWNPAAGGTIHSLLQGNAPNRRLTIEWAGVPLFPATGAATFEVTLFETSDQILMQYQDTVVGDVLSDNGATAVVGLENGVGVNGVAASCFTATVADSTARRYRRFAGPTTVYSTDVEPVAPGWNAFAITGPNLWHNGVEPTCAPIARSGTTSLYYGQDASCTYDTPGQANSARAVSPVISALPQDASLRFWNRRQTEDFPPFDLSVVEVQGDGGGFTQVAQIVDERNAWVFSDDFLSADPLSGTFAPIDLSSYAGQDLEIQFRFDTFDPTSNGFFGWAVDDIKIEACPVFSELGGAAGAAEARATAQPDAICETSAGMVDAVGSYCTVCPVPLTFQWRENGTPVPGATGISHAIPPGHATGNFGYSVEIACPTTTACGDESAPALVSVVQAPVEVGPTLAVELLLPGTDLQFHWSDVSGADDYVLFASTDASVPFTSVVGTSGSGMTGVTAPIGPDSLVFFLVAGRNPVCGIGPLK